MPARQRIFVVRTTADRAELLGVRGKLGRRPVVLAAPTTESRRVVDALAVEPRVETLLAPASYPNVDRGHQVDSLVRRHAVDDRFRDVVVVTDPATSTLLLRVLAPDQLSDPGSVTVVGLPRAPRRADLRRVLVIGVVLGVLSSVAESLAPILTLPAVVALAGVVLLPVPSLRHLGRELLLAAATGFVVVVLMTASEQRFPG